MLEGVAGTARIVARAARFLSLGSTIAFIMGPANHCVVMFLAFDIPKAFYFKVSKPWTFQTIVFVMFSEP